MTYEGEGVGSTPSGGTERKTFEEVMSKLISISDVSGVAIIRLDGSVISWRMKDSRNPTKEFDFINKYISAAYKKNIHYWKSGLFTESVLDYNGHKILLSRIKEDVVLLLVLDKKAYLGLTMLDLEGCLREVDTTLEECCARFFNGPG